MAITDPAVRELKRYLRNLEKRLLDVDQRVARTIMRGKVAKVRKKGDDYEVKLELGRDPETDRVVESPWSPVQPVAAGSLKIKVKPVVGEAMTLLSPSGVLGSASMAIRSPYDDDHPAPKGDEDVVLEVGATKLVIKDGLFSAKVGDNEVELKSDAFNIVVKNGDGYLVGKWYLGVDEKDQKAGALVATEAGPAKQVKAKV
jgi:phage baseplate assembly protein gpV